MDSVRILIADYNEAFRENLAELLQAHFTVKTCDNGAEAKYFLSRFEPDIFVLDLMLPSADTFALLEDALSRGAEVYVFSTFISVSVRERLLSMGIYGMLPKTCDIYQAEYNIRAMARRLPAVVRQREMDEVSELLLRLGFKANYDGYQQLLYAIPMFARDRKQPVNKVIYSDIAKRFGLSGSKSVEHAIREAIAKSYLLGDTALWNQLFPAESLCGRKAPSNKQFIARICEYLQREYIR